jgi:hypothetical protein
VFFSGINCKHSSAWAGFAGSTLRVLFFLPLTHNWNAFALNQLCFYFFPKFQVYSTASALDLFSKLHGRAGGVYFLPQTIFYFF